MNDERIIEDGHGSRKSFISAQAYTFAVCIRSRIAVISSRFGP